MKYKLKVRGPVLLRASQAQGSTGGSTWDVDVFTYGKSLRPPFFVYTRESAQNSIPVFDGARVYANSHSTDFGHTNMANKTPRDIVGVLRNPVAGPDRLSASLVILPSGEWLSKDLAFARESGIPFPYELSIDAAGMAHMGDHAGEQLPIVDGFSYAALDVVERGAAGGQFQSLKESLTQEDGIMNKEQLLALLKANFSDMFKGKNVNEETITVEELGSMLTEFSTPKAVETPATPATPETPATPVTPDPKVEEAKLAAALNPLQKMLQAVQGKLAQATLDGKLRESKLPENLQVLVRESFKGQIPTDEQIDASIKRTRDTFASFLESARQVDPHGLGIRVGAEERDKVILGLDGFFMRGSIKPLSTEEQKTMLKGIPGFRSIREAYIAYTGDVNVTGLKKDSRMSESLTTASWAEVVSASINKRVLRDYPLLNLDTWRPLVDIVPLTDFKTQRRIRVGGYPNLPVRPQRAPYLPLASPTDEEAIYTPATRGGTEDLTREMIMNDDVAAVGKIPQRLTRAAAQTLHEFVFDLIHPAVNPVIYDGVVLYHTASHANLGTTALDATPFKAARLRMKQQTMMDNLKRLGLRAGFLIVPSDLEEMAYSLLTPAAGNTNAVPKFEQQVGVSAIVVDYWTDAKDWLLASKREDLVGLELGFIGGQENPEIFVSDVANVGSWFTNDVITYKIRHEYGAVITDYRAFDGSVVS